jgi:hypothetical protein
MPIHNSHAGSHYALDVDGAPVESLKAISGFDMLADIALDVPASGAAPKKHVSNIQWTPGKATIGIGMGKGMYEWMKDSFDKGRVAARGTLGTGDFNYKERSRITFEDALLTSITMPRLDGSSKDSGAFEIEFLPGRVRVAKGDGADIRQSSGTRQQPWVCSNFRFELGALPCARVASIESFTWSCAPTVATVFEPAPGPALNVPDLRLSISAADYDDWAEAAQRWFIDGRHLEGDEMHGRITLLTPDLQTPLGSIELINAGFRRFSPLPRRPATMRSTASRSTSTSSAWPCAWCSTRADRGLGRHVRCSTGHTCCL